MASPGSGNHAQFQERRARSYGALWFLEAGLLLAVVIPVLLVLTTPDVGRSDAWVLTLGFLVWSGIRLSIILGSGKPRIFEFMFWLFVYIFLGLAPTIQIRTADISSTAKDMPASVDWPTALIIGLSIIAFEVGRLLPGRHRRLSGARRWRLSPGLTWLLFFLGLAATAYYVQSVGIGSLFQTREARQVARIDSFEDSSNSAIVGALSWVPLLVAAGSFLAMRRHRVRMGWSAKYGSVALIAALCVLVVVNPVSGARYTAGTVLFAMVCYTGVLVREHLTRPVLAAVLGAFLFLFPIADAFRRTEVDVSRAGFFAEYQGNGDYDSFWQIANAYLYNQANGPTWGHQAIGVLLFWVPRSIWPGKPEDTGVVLADFRGYSFTNLSAPLWAEALINGGLVVLVIVFLALGLLLVRLDQAVPRAMATDSGLAIAACMLPAYMIILLRGSLLQATGVLVIMLVSMLIVSLDHARAPDAAGPKAGDSADKGRTAGRAGA